MPKNGSPDHAVHISIVPCRNIQENDFWRRLRRSGTPLWYSSLMYRATVFPQGGNHPLEMECITVLTVSFSPKENGRWAMTIMSAHSRLHIFMKVFVRFMFACGIVGWT
mmetsp:Transcript_30449/g.51187  ORF Transcript_30449/g.51187 Transcript_30449/m.51187 type:complete len:109 (+) Transcript_30449:2041-2367(+)